MRPLIFLLAGLLTGPLPAWSFGVQEPGPGGAALVVANGAEPQTLDPHLAVGRPEGRIVQALFEGLVSWDPRTLQAVPGLAERWEASPDGRVFTFHLRVTSWSDGVPITAHTVVSSWLRVLDPRTGSPWAWLPALFIEGADAYAAGEAGPEAVRVRALDDLTLQVQLAGPRPSLPAALPHRAFAVVPMHLVERVGPEWGRGRTLVGNGPFVLDEWVPGDRLTVVPNRVYWDRAEVRSGSVVYLAKGGEAADWIPDISPEQAATLRGRADFHVSPLLATYYYTLQNQAAPLDDPRVRRALSASVERGRLAAEVTGGGEIPAGTLVPPLDGYRTWTAVPDDIEAARALLAESGFPGGRGFPELEILHPPHPLHRAVAAFVSGRWRENLGIEAVPVELEWREYAARRRDGEFQVARAGWAGEYPDPALFLEPFTGGAADLEGCRYSNPEFDQWLSRAASLPAGQERLEALRRAEELLVVEDRAVIPLYHYTARNRIDLSRWGGWFPNALDVHPPKYWFRKP